VSTDNAKTTLLDSLRQRDLRLFSQILTPQRVAQAALAVGKTIGTSPLNLLNLSWLALACAWNTSVSFVGVLEHFLELHHALHDSSWAETPSPQHANLAVSEEAFCQARHRVPALFWDFLLGILMEEFQRLYPRLVYFKQFRVLDLDGTCLSVPDSAANRSYFGTASKGSGRKAPRARLVNLLLPFARLPLSYRLGAYTDSERTLARPLLAQLQRNDLVLMDRGFWSYGLFWQIQHRDAFFATRQKARVGLTKVRDLGPDDELVEHSPKDWRKSWKKEGLPETITLRVIHYQLKGFRPSAVVTNVLDPEQISREEWIRLVEVNDRGVVLVKAGLYHRRWEIETSYRELKCEQGLEGGLRSRKPEGIGYEVGGHLLLYALIRWRIVEAAEAAGLEDPLRISFSRTLEVMEVMMWLAWVLPEEEVNAVLLPRLLRLLAENLVPLRPGRHYPRPRDGKPKTKTKTKKSKKAQTKKNGARAA
jgi:hypothetical protein